MTPLRSKSAVGARANQTVRKSKMSWVVTPSMALKLIGQQVVRLLGVPQVEPRPW